MTSSDPNAPTEHAPDESGDDLAQFFAERPAGDSDADLQDEPQQIGARLAEARSTAGLSQRQIADRLGVRESTVAKWETGETVPRGHGVSKLAGMLGVSISWILMGRGVEPVDHTSDIDQVRHELNSVRARLDDVVNELAVLDQRLASLDED